MPRMKADKFCGGVLLKNFPEGAGEKKTEKQGAVLTVIIVFNLTAQEQERLEEAEVSVTNSSRKGKID